MLITELQYKLADGVGFEPTIFRLTGERLYHLSLPTKNLGLDNPIRTDDLRAPNAPLYQTELYRDTLPFDAGSAIEADFASL